jgi:thiamine-phosphate diphosphorylase/hydroxyethylthiazole kinase
VNKKPLVFDPVAIGATSFRREVSKREQQPVCFIRANQAELLSHWQPTVIKGNAAEIGAMAESTEVSTISIHLLALY